MEFERSLQQTATRTERQSPPSMHLEDLLTWRYKQRNTIDARDGERRRQLAEPPIVAPVKVKGAIKTPAKAAVADDKA